MDQMESLFQVNIICEDHNLSSDELRNRLAVFNPTEADPSVAIRALPDVQFPSVLVIASAAVLRELIKGIVQIAVERMKLKISIQKTDGERITQELSRENGPEPTIEKILNVVLDSRNTVIRF